MAIVGTLVAGTFALLSALHIFWACGGRWGGAAAVPEVAGRSAFTPSTLATVAVAAALLAAAILVALRAGLVDLAIPTWLPKAGCWTLTAVFALRATGDFRLIGFFKSVRGTTFATRDSLLYSPLCLLLALGCALLAWRGAR